MALAAMSLNFLLGFTGVLSFGHAAYFGLGAYGVGMTIKYIVPSTSLGILIGVLVGTVAAAIIGALIVRLRGVYFAMVTIAFGQVFFFIAFRWNDVTGGDDGLGGWRRQPLDLGFTQIDILGNDKAFYYLVLVLFALAVGVMALLLRSPFGRSLLAIRENERRARFLGIPIEFHIWLSFVISCLFVSLAGTLYALLNNFADPRALRWEQVGQFRHHGRAGRHALLLGSADRRGDLRGAAGLHLEPDRELDVASSACSSCWWCCSSRRGVLGIIRRKVSIVSLAPGRRMSHGISAA